MILVVLLKETHIRSLTEWVAYIDDNKRCTNMNIFVYVSLVVILLHWSTVTAHNYTCQRKYHITVSAAPTSRLKIESLRQSLSMPSILNEQQEFVCLSLSQIKQEKHHAPRIHLTQFRTISCCRTHLVM